MGRFPEEGPKDSLGVPEEGSHLTAVGAAWSIFLFVCLKQYLTICLAREKDVNYSGCLH